MQNRLLLVASYYFYGAWDWRFLGLIIFSTTVDYFVGIQLENTPGSRRRKFLLSISISANLGLLCIFKYLGFFVESFSILLDNIGVHSDPILLSIILPVGISFYTFQTLSYTLDIYRSDLKAIKDFFDFALFVAFFPQLVAGPIERARNLLPEIASKRTFSCDLIERGAMLCLLGLIKKIVIADAVAPSVESIYSSPNPSGAAILTATYLFAIQIYCDFSGYTDIARGVAKMLGFRLMKNFSQPYFASSPSEFWSRWHISLSTWLRDYLYISLGGNRINRFCTYRNLIITMLLGGLWHGAAWNFVIWGLYHGGLLSFYRLLTELKVTTTIKQQRNKFSRRIVKFFSIILFFQVISYGWLLFRASSFSQIVDFSNRLLDIRLVEFVDLPIAPPFPALCGLFFLLIWDIYIEISGKVNFYANWPTPWRASLYATSIYLLAFGATSTPSAFIYFQF